MGTSAFTQAGFENYTLFDANCMKQYDYIRSSNYHDVPFWDFHFEVSPHQTYIFRVLKQEAYQDEVNKLDKEPISCNNNRMLDNSFVQEVNSARKTAYIVIYDAQNKIYKLFQVKKVIHFTETAYALSYKDQQRSFLYNYNEINQGANLDTTQQARVLFEGNSKYDCARQRKFRSFDKLNPRLTENLYFIEKIGLAKIETETGSLELQSINNEPLKSYVQKHCKNLGTTTPPAIEQPRINPTKKDSSKVVGIDSELPNPFGTKKTPLTKTPVKSVQDSMAGKLDENGIYTVQEGDNLYKIATKYNTSVEAIKSINGLSSNIIDLNQKLKIKTSTPFKDNNPVYKTDANTGIRTKIHVVNQGECLWDIARRYNTTLKNLVEINALSSEKIDIEQEIIIEKTVTNR